MVVRKTAAQGAALAALLWAATPAAGQESALRDGLNDVARDIAKMLTEEADQTGERLRVSFRPARTTPLKGTDIWCEPLSFGLRNALHGGVEWHMRVDSFDVVVANERAVEPPDVTMSWAWDGAETVQVEAHVLLPGDRRAPPYPASLPVSKMGERERACLFTYRPGGGEVEAKTAGFLRDEPSVDPAGIVHRFGPGEKLQIVGELSSEGGSGAVWSVVPWEDPETGGFRNLFSEELAGGAVDLAGGAVVRDPDDEAPRIQPLERGSIIRDLDDEAPRIRPIDRGRLIRGL